MYTLKKEKKMTDVGAQTKTNRRNRESSLPKNTPGGAITQQLLICPISFFFCYRGKDLWKICG